MDDLISRKSLLSAYDEKHKGPAGGARKLIEDAPSIPAVPLDKLCEWLAVHYGSPCQLGEIDPYPQCEPDENGECYGMRTDDKRCWHDYLTKWMEELNAAD